MIEVVIDERCTGCGTCVDACPSDVLEVGSDGKARIARQADCQTCLLCELHCASDALFVWPDCEAPAGITAAQALASGQLGAFRRNSGWGEHAATHSNQHWRMGSIFERARLQAIQIAAQKSAQATSAQAEETTR
ncbi:ferredoxin family protein [Caulobacter sp. UNC358MFTsu5.1]|uniref:4Fe-4S dicluster domain-containing protein n=1 Tax=Caulobacter sp. UNC358MFTsu5.1 TaxID=1449049 RepID=UPI0004A706BD|nr:ferredoxin family protein [Caulobacter sp. UNC358MFTsu5.1]